MPSTNNDFIEYERVVIDLSGPGGNAFSLLAQAKKIGLEIGLPKEKVVTLIAKMTSGDYDNLIRVFEEEFNDYVSLVGR